MIRGTEQLKKRRAQRDTKNINKTNSIVMISVVTSYVGKPPAVGQPTRPFQPFVLLGSINE